VIPPASEGWDTVVFLPGTWQESFRRYLVQAFARGMRGLGNVLCVERPWSPFRSLVSKTRRYGGQRLSRPRVHQMEDNLFIVSPYVVLHPLVADYLPAFPMWNRQWLKRQLAQAFGQAHWRNRPFVVWLFHPFQLEEADLWPKNLLVYDCYDRYDQPPEPVNALWKRKLRDREKTLLTMADLVMTASRPLQQLKASQGFDSHWLPNAVDWDLFKAAGNGHLAMAGDLSPIPSPRLGFIGHMNERIDFELLDQLAERRPLYSIVLVGSLGRVTQASNAAALQRLQKRSNVFLLGPRPYDQLPNYLQGFDLCLVPYADTPFNRCCSPLKLYEYLASGKPVVSVAIPEIEPFNDVVTLVRDRSRFPAAVDAELRRTPDEARKQERLRRAEQNTWDTRARTMIDWLSREEVLRS